MKNIKKPFVGLLLCCLIPTGLWAQEAASWLKMPSCARVAGMGGAFGAMGGDVASLDVNPAGLGALEKPEVMILHNAWFQGVAMEKAAMGLPLGTQDFIALGLDYLSWGSVDAYGVSNGSVVANGAVNPGSFSGSAAYARQWENKYLVGASVKYVLEDIGGTVNSTVGGDLGVLVRNVVDNLSLGLSVQNIGGTIRDVGLPSEMRAGLAYQSGVFEEQHAVNLAADVMVSLAKSRAVAFAFGAEYWYRDALALRVGDQVSQDKAGSGVDGITLGAGLKLEQFRLDYAFVKNGGLGDSHLVSLTTRL